MLSDLVLNQPPPAFTPGNYGSGLSHDEPGLPNYSISIEPDIWESFSKRADASLEVANAKRRLVLLERDLEKQSKELKKHRECTSKLFKDLHRRSALETIQQPLNALRRIPSRGSYNDEKKSKQRADFEASHQLETQMQEFVSALEEEKRELQSKIDINTPLVCEMDQIFELVASHVAATSSCTNIEEIQIAEKNLEAQTASYNKAEEIVKNFQRGCVTVQHAHHYYSSALQCLDAVRGGVGPVLFSGISEVSKNRDYQAAATLAGKAQVCFNETIRVMTPYVTEMPNEVLSDFEQLKDLGLLQATKIYDLMYSWKGKASDTGGSVKLMFQRQETVFACLTRFAVWVQTQNPVVESEAQGARSMKIVAQKRLVRLWEQQCKNSVS